MQTNMTTGTDSLTDGSQPTFSLTEVCDAYAEDDVYG